MKTNDAAASAPHVWAGSSTDRVYRVRLLALVAVVVAAILNTGYQYLLANELVGSTEANASVRSFGPIEVVVTGLGLLAPVLITAAFTAGFWERVFSHTRQRRFDAGIFVIPVVFTMLVPPGTSLGHVVFVMSFAIIFGRGVFGGEGKTFLNPALLAVALLQISFPTFLAADELWTGVAGYSGTRAFALFHQDGISGLLWVANDWVSAFVGNTQGMLGTSSVLAVLIGGAVLTVGGVACWRLMLAQVLGVVAMAVALNTFAGANTTPQWWWHLVLGSFAFGAVFVATDSASAAGTRAGRWIQGLLMGAAVVFLRTINPSHPDSVVAVLLLGSMLAPLIDFLVVRQNVKQRERRDARFN